MVANRLALALLAVACVLGFATAARIEQFSELGHSSTKQLNTYYFDISKPRMALTSHASSRPERTALTVHLSKASVSRFMPVVSPKGSGMTHAVSDSWQALKNLAAMFTHVNAINKQSPGGPRLFPKAALAVSSASDSSLVKLDMNAVINAAEAMAQRHTWAETTPSSVLVLPAGQSIGAVADLFDVTYDGKTDSIALQLDVVHNPRMTSEFEPHGPQTLQVDEAHYHFATAPGVKVDAQALLSRLESNGFTLDGMHVFMKGFAQSFPWSCITASMTADKMQAPVGSSISVTIQLDDSGCEAGIKAPGSQTTIQQAGGVIVPVLVQGYYYWTVDIGVNVSVATSATSQADAQQTGPVVLVQTDGQGQAEFTITVTRPGCGAVVLYGAPSGPLQDPPSLLINCRDSQGPVSSLGLSPFKAYRHIHDPVQLSALALDANKKPVAGASIAFSVYGNCDPTTDSATATTGADGVATVRLVADKPGAMSVVAAAADTAGAPVLSGPSHIFYFAEREYADELEHAYYGHHREDMRHEDSHAYSYAKVASQRAQEMVSQSA